MLKRKTFLKKKTSRDISASRNLRLRRLKHRKATFNLFIILYFSKESFKRSSARRDSPLC